MAASEKYDAIVIGAGWAGVVAARDLTERSYRVLIVEARDRVGGRSFYREFADTNHKVEMGGGWIEPEFNHDIMREIERYGAPIGPSPEGRTHISLFGERRIEGHGVFTPEHMMGIEQTLWRMVTDARRIDPDLPLDVQGLEDLDISVTDYFNAIDVPLELREMCRAWIRLNSGASEDDVSALHMLSWAGYFGYSPAALGLLPTHVLTDGTKSLIDAIVEDSEADVALSSPVQTIRRTADGVEVQTRGGDSHAARGAVVALPINCWGDVEFDPKLSVGKNNIAELKQPGASKKIWAMTSGEPELISGAGGKVADIDVMAGEYRFPDGDLYVGFTNQDRDYDATDPRSIERALRQYSPNLTVTKSDHHDWLDDEFSKGTWFAGRPGFLSRYASALCRPEGPLVFAGSDTSPIFRGFMTGAVHSGGQAAQQLAKILS